MSTEPSRHSATTIADGDVVLDLGTMPERFEVGPDGTSVTVIAAMTYPRLAELHGPIRRAVANLASLPHVSVAGATATATHGSGDRNGNLATSSDPGGGSGAVHRARTDTWSVRRATSSLSRRRCAQCWRKSTE